MRVAFCLEAIDDHLVHKYEREKRSWPDWKEKPPKPYVARLHGLSFRFGYDREFLDGRKDYTDANRKGSRGVYVHWVLEEGALYEIQELRVRKKPRRYFARATNGAAGGIEEISETELRLWLLENVASELACSLLPSDASPGPSTAFLASVLASLAEKIRASCCTS